MRPLPHTFACFLLALGSAALASAPAQAAPADVCAVPEALRQIGAMLPATAAALAGHRPLTIVALGSNSTLGTAAGGSDHAYPRDLERLLRARRPAQAITVYNSASHRMSAQEMLLRLEQAILPGRPTLVIWEVGTYEAVHELDPDNFEETLQSGLDSLRAKGVDVILMDMQYSGVTSAIIDFTPYLETLHHVASYNDIPLLPRYDMMRYWSDQGGFDFDAAPAGTRKAMAAEIYRCLARRLAEMILGAHP